MTRSEFELLIVGGTLLIFLLICAIVTFIFMLQKRHYVYVEEKKRLILNAKLEIQEQTLQQVGQELHDHIGQMLSVVKINLNRIEESETALPHAGLLEKTNTLVSKIIDDVRSMSKGLNIEFVQKYGIIDCVRFELDRLENTGKYTTTFIVEGERQNLNLQCEFVAYRVIQECINNIIKHANADKVDIYLHYSESKLLIAIADNGKGFNKQDVAEKNIQSSGNGLSNIRKRLEMVNSEFEIESITGMGTKVSLFLPYQNQKL